MYDNRIILSRRVQKVADFNSSIKKALKVRTNTELEVINNIYDTEN
jgi:hypothetical protein